MLVVFGHNVKEIKFNVPFLAGNERKYLDEVFQNMQFAGNGPFTNRVQSFLEAYLNAPRVLLTHSCTGALELAAMLAGFGPGDEVIVPSFTFVTSASAIQRTGATVVFCEVDQETMIVDLVDLESKITEKTKGVVIVDYAGNTCNFEQVTKICSQYGLECIEDAAQGLGSLYKGKKLSTLARFGAISFHETKNIHSGLGGCLVINNQKDVEKAEMVWERGTNRSAFFKGLVDKYSWQEIGSSFYPSELQAAFLFAQLEGLETNLKKRKDVWESYFNEISKIEKRSKFRILKTPDWCENNAHLFGLIFDTPEMADKIRIDLNKHGINAVIHYVPLHESKVGAELGYTASDLPITSNAASCLLRLPLHHELSQDDVFYIIQILGKLLDSNSPNYRL